MTDRETREAAADLIDRAMDLLCERGWCKNHLRDVQGQMCVDGALRTADGQDLYRANNLNGSPAYWTAYTTVCHEARRELAGTGVAAFNDHPKTTLEDVLLAGKRAAHSLRQVSA